MDDIAISVEHVSKTFKLPHEKQSSIKGSLINILRGGGNKYEKQTVLKNVSFEVKKGEFFGIVGRNGSGKSTLLKMLAGTYVPSTGRVQVNGKLTPFIELGVGFNPELTGRENVFLNGALLGFNRKEMNAMYGDIVAFAELEKFMDQKLKNYSSGMQVRLAFSIAVRAQSDILLLDEVLAVGDAAFQQKCYDYFEELKLAKKTVVFVSHDMGAVTRFCTKALYITQGNITLSGDPLDVADAYNADNTKSILEDQGPETKLAQESDSIKISVVEQNKEKQDLRFRISYTSKIKTYIGFSVIKDGMTFAELNSLSVDSKKEDGSLEYILDTSVLNPGLYEISAALLSHETKQPLAVTRQRAKFNLVGKRDLTRGGALHLKDGWIYQEG